MSSTVSRMWLLTRINTKVRWCIGNHRPAINVRIARRIYRNSNIVFTTLRLDYCENGHGFWLDAGEDVRVMGIMATRAAEIQRKVDTESEWRGILKQMHLFLRK